MLGVSADGCVVEMPEWLPLAGHLLPIFSWIKEGHLPSKNLIERDASLIIRSSKYAIDWDKLIHRQVQSIPRIRKVIYQTVPVSMHM